MNLSYRWLRALAPTITGSPREVADRLATLGAPVDEMTPLGEELGDVVIARVSDVQPHPNADRLRLCTVEAGADPLQVVCGAPNVEAGRYYPFAPIGSTLPGGIKIRKAKLRGEVSEGMLCSPRELGLGRDHAGLMTLSGEYLPGESFVEGLELDDVRLVIDVTPNRPDLLSHIGAARELAPGGVDDVVLDPFSTTAPQLDLRSDARAIEAAGVRIGVEDLEGCPRYLAAVVRGVRVGPSPEWLATRLRSIGSRPINNVVDATNYVLHELGQPLHAFDLATLGGSEIRVRRAAPGETIRTLDGVDRLLDDSMLVIADAERPIALAGVMGGEATEVTETTTDVLIECARFDGRAVRRTARALGLSTDASFRFERGVDPTLQPRALARVVDLILAIAGGRPEPETAEVLAAPRRPTSLHLRPARVRAVLGVQIGPEEIEQLLHPIGFDVREAGDALELTVPRARPDVEREIDVIEEIARRRGYDSFPEELEPFRPSRVPEDGLAGVEREVRRVMDGWGVLEARTAAFAPAAEHRVPLLNPLSAEESHLRDELLPGLLRRVEYNWARGIRDIRLYEIGTVFAAGDGARPAEETRLAVALTGARRPPHWSHAAETFDVWDLKGLVGELAEAFDWSIELADGAATSRRFRVIAPGPRPVGAAGGAVEESLDAPAWAAPVWWLEVALPRSLERRAPSYQPVPNFPAVDRDLALLVPRGITAAEVEAVVRDAAGETLSSLRPFDVYAGEGIPEDTRSIAWRLRFRDPERTLTDAEVDRVVDAVLGALEERVGVRRR